MSQLERILILCAGTRGDMQPFLALGLTLKEEGYDVHFLTNANLAVHVVDAGLKAHGILPDSEKLLKESPVLMKAMAEGDAAAFSHPMALVPEDLKEPILKALFETLEEVKPDLVVEGNLCDYFGHICELMAKIPVVQITLQVYPGHCKHMMYGLPNLPCGLNDRTIRKMMFDSSYELLCEGWDPVLERLNGCKIATLTSKEYNYERYQNPPPWGLLIGVSNEVAKVLDPTPWPNHVHVGQLAVDSAAQVASAQAGGKEEGLFGSAEGMEKIKTFIAAGSKPVYLGWGSMTAKSPEYMVKLAAESARIANVRAIIFEGWAHMSMATLKEATDDASLIEYAEQNLLYIGKAPHEWLFPQMSCIVHHGGAGTLCTVMRAGVPQVITPIFLDQWDHAHFLNRRGCGVGFEKKNLPKLSAQEIGKAIKTCVGSETIARVAKEVGDKVQEEHGTKTAAVCLEKFWVDYVKTGKYREYRVRVEARIAAQKGGRYGGA